MTFVQEFDQLVQRAEVAYALLLIAFLLTYIAFGKNYRKPSTDDKNRQ